MSSPATSASLEAALGQVVLPDVGRSLHDMGALSSVSVEGRRGRATVVMPMRAASAQAPLRADLEQAANSIGVDSLELAFETKITSRDILPDDVCPGVANVILVMSGKGGVGKSTVAANLALALKKQGASVGLLDADMYGPSIPTMFGVMGRPTSRDGQKFLPLERFGVKLMSIGFLLENDRQAVVWRGPMLQGALLQFLKDVDWGELDYLVLDLPPGTGDVALTLSQKVRSTGAVVVTTPQEVALQDVYKSVAMAQKVGIEILGVVENESVFVCDGCGKRHPLFGEGGGARVAEMAQAPLLARLPIDPAVREWGDSGTPVVHAAPSSPVAQELVALAARVEAKAARQNLSRGASLAIDRSGGQNRRLPIMR